MLDSLSVSNFVCYHYFAWNCRKKIKLFGSFRNKPWLPCRFTSVIEELYFIENYNINLRSYVSVMP